MTTAELIADYENVSLLLGQHIRAIEAGLLIFPASEDAITETGRWLGKLKVHCSEYDAIAIELRKQVDNA